MWKQIYHLPVVNNPLLPTANFQFLYSLISGFQNCEKNTQFDTGIKLIHSILRNCFVPYWCVGLYFTIEHFLFFILLRNWHIWFNVKVTWFENELIENGSIGIFILFLVFGQNFFFNFAVWLIRYRYRDPCSASIDEDDLHTTKLIGDPQRRVSIWQFR